MMKEELSVKDLMINDWVNVVIEGEIYPSVITKMDRDTEDLRVAFLAVPGDWEEGDFFDEIQPIPLTSELLEKNGFERVPQPGCANPYHWMLEKYEEESDGLLYRIKAFNNPFRGMFVSIDNPSDCETINFGKQIEHDASSPRCLWLRVVDKNLEADGNNVDAVITLRASEMKALGKALVFAAEYVEGLYNE